MTSCQMNEYQIHEHIVGNPHKKGLILTHITPLEDLSHIQRHWDGSEFGSRFMPNEHFSNAEECARFLEGIAKVVIDQQELDRHHLITVVFNCPIGKDAIILLSRGQETNKVIRDFGKAGQAEVLIAPNAYMQNTHFLTMQFKPFYPPKGSKGQPVEFLLICAFPGLPAPRLITDKRIKSYQINPQNDVHFSEDKKFWQTHAFARIF